MWTLVFLFVATWHNGGGWNMSTPLPADYVSTEIKVYATRAEAEAALIERMKAFAPQSGYSPNAIPAIAGPYTTSSWAGDALLVSPTGKVEQVHAVMGKRKVVKEVEMEEETGWRVEVRP